MEKSVGARVAAIVVTYNRLALLKECLKALDVQSYPLSKIYVVDNASTDGTQAWFEQSSLAKDEKFEFVQLGKNVGGAGGFEAGMAYAMKHNYDWLWLMDDDSIADRTSLKALLESPVSQQANVGVLASKVSGIDEEILEMNRQFTFDSRTGDRHWVDLKQFEKDSFEVDCTSFVGFLIRTDVVAKIGLPIGGMFIHFDDHEYSLRVRAHGYKIVVVPGSVIVHKLTLMRDKDSRYLYIFPKELWKYYYGQRNEVWGLVRYIHPWHRKLEFMARRGYWALKWSLVHIRYDHPWLSLRLLWQSYFDACFNRLGKRIDPATFIQHLK